MFNSTKHLSLGIAFIAGMIVVILLLGSQSSNLTGSTIVIQNGVQEEQGPERCTETDDCSNVTAYCNNEGLCELLNDVRCSCSQPLVMRCSDKKGKGKRAHHRFCPEGCRETEERITCE